MTSPPAGDAYNYCTQLLALGPQNERAHKGVSEIAERYVVLAEQEFAGRDFRKSRIYIALGCQVDPSHHDLAALETFIGSQPIPFWEGLVSLFKS